MKRPIPLRPLKENKGKSPNSTCIPRQSDTCIHSPTQRAYISEYEPHTRFLLQGWPLSALLPQAAAFPRLGHDSDGILCYLGGPPMSREGGVMGCFWSFAESRAKRLKPGLVLLQPPAPPAPRPPSAQHVTAEEQQENAEELLEVTPAAPNRPSPSFLKEYVNVKTCKDILISLWIKVGLAHICGLLGQRSVGFDLHTEPISFNQSLTIFTTQLD